ncbi:hypothetical protein [Streptomyces armeniacus]|uniref:hypothetical protein n=1 Tax=Streptomyces armeniacus TaxID=83291 RepID=UPI001AD84E51|nr:hypothetical protein [Streptomyces armeniacus]
MYENEYRAHLLKIDDLRREAGAERRARRAVDEGRRQRREEEAEGRVRRHRVRWARAA